MYRIINCTKIKTQTNEIEIPALFERYVRKPLEDSNSAYHDSYSYGSAWNQCIASVYHCDSLAFLPGMVYEDIMTSNPCIFDIHKQKMFPFYIIPLETNLSVKRAVFILNPINLSQLPFYIRPFATRMSRYTMDEVEIDKKSYVVINGTRYLLLGKNHLIDDRLKDIIWE